MSEREKERERARGKRTEEIEREWYKMKKRKSDLERERVCVCVCEWERDRTKKSFETTYGEITRVVESAVIKMLRLEAFLISLPQLHLEEAAEKGN
jgi:hypothetical protein